MMYPNPISIVGYESELGSELLETSLIVLITKNNYINGTTTGWITVRFLNLFTCEITLFF